MDRKNNFWMIVITAFVLVSILIVFFLTIRNTTFRREKNIESIRSKMQKSFFSSIDKNIVRTLVLDMDIFDQDFNFKYHRLQYFKRPDKIKIVMEDKITGKDYVFIAKGDKFWFNQKIPPLIIDALIQKVGYFFLSVKENIKDQLPPEVKSINLKGKRCFVFTHRYDFGLDKKFKVISYIDSSTFDCFKVEVYFWYMGSWHKIGEEFLEDIREINGLRLAHKVVMNIYMPKENYTLRGYLNSVQVNVDLKESLFEF
jgi:hypothetical protein